MSDRRVRIAPSILSADFSRLASDIQAAEAGGAELLHLDIMDGHFVPNLTLGPAVVKSIRKVTRLILDAHLMVTDPMAFVGPFRAAGADWISFHIEAAPDPAAVGDPQRDAGGDHREAADSEAQPPAQVQPSAHPTPPLTAHPALPQTLGY